VNEKKPTWKQQESLRDNLAISPPPAWQHTTTGSELTTPRFSLRNKGFELHNGHPRI